MVKITDQNKENQRLKQINESALRLLFKFGVRKLTIDDICRESSVSKATFYKFYENKLDMVLYLLEDLTSHSCQEYRKIMDSDLPFEEKVEQTIRLKMYYANLLSKDFVEDILKNGGPAVIQLLQEQTVVAMKMFYEDYQVAQQKGLIRRDLNLRFILYFINHLNEIIQDPEFKVIYSNPGEMVLELINFFFYGIMPRRGNHYEK